MDWIINAYDGNPIFVTNPYTYYKNVEMGVGNTLIEQIRQHIVDGEIDEIIGIIAMRSILSTYADQLFGQYVEDWTNYDSDLKEIFEDRDRFTWEAYIGGTLEPINNPYHFVQLALAELDLRNGSEIRSATSSGDSARALATPFSWVNRTILERGTSVRHPIK